MPRYFFDLNDGSEVRDDRGRELAGLGAARNHAGRLLTRYIRGADHAKTTGGAFVVDARDSIGNHVFTARLVFSVEGR